MSRIETVEEYEASRVLSVSVSSVRGVCCRERERERYCRLSASVSPLPVAAFPLLLFAVAFIGGMSDDSWEPRSAASAFALMVAAECHPGGCDASGCVSGRRKRSTCGSGSCTA